CARRERGNVMRRSSRWAFVLGLVAAPGVPGWAQSTSILGNNLTMRSSGTAAGNSWTLGASGFVGTYLTVPAGGATVNFNINATEGSGFAPAPHMNLVIADSTFGFNVANTSASDYTTGNVFLPGGTYVVRTERDFTGNTSTTRSFNVN